MFRIKENVEGYIRQSDSTRGALATALGISRSSFYDKLNGKRPWMLDEAAKLAEVMGCTIDDLANKQIYTD